MNPLDGPRLKVRRARGQIELLKEIQHSFGRVSDYEIVRAEFNQKTGRYVYRARGAALPHPDWGVWIGEIAHNLRSALDGLVYQLVLANGKEPDLSTQFPIFVKRTSRKVRGRWIHGFEGTERGSGRDMIRLISPKHQAIIERWQPYHRNGRWRTGPNHPLSLLREINNADKHRLIQVVGVRPAALLFATDQLLTSDNLSRGGFVILKQGRKILEAAPEVLVRPKVTPEMAFWKGCKAAVNRRVYLTFAFIAGYVSKIVDDFGPELGDQLLPLPPPSPHELSPDGALRAFGAGASIAWMTHRYPPEPQDRE